MELALYHPQEGYYRQAPDQILGGGGGDFYTASQLQPVFGRIISALLPLGEPVLELGAGRGEMQRALGPRSYRAVGPGELPPSVWRGSIFANEFFDALPVVAGIRLRDQLYEMAVQRQGGSFRWVVGPILSEARQQYVHQYFPRLSEGSRFEIAERAVDTIRRLSKSLVTGTMLVIDYGWVGDEYLRFPEGTLMSYRRHVAVPDVLTAPGRQDITSHVPFPVLMDTARQNGFQVLSCELLAQTVLRVGERAGVLDVPHDRQQLKTLLFGMGQSFRVLTLQKGAAQ